jgi:putative membrane protein
LCLLRQESDLSILGLRFAITSCEARRVPAGIRFAAIVAQEAHMRRIVITAGLACAMALPGFASAQTATSGQSGQSGSTAQGTKSGSGSQGSTSSGSGSSAQGAKSAKPAGAAAQSGSTAASGGAALAPMDKTFAMHAAQGGLAEVQMGKLAAQNASSPDVKQFGQRMVDDHGKANDELMSWASKNSVTLPTDLDAKHKADEARVSKLTGAAFDRAYMALMVADHNKDVAEFKRASTTAKNPDLKAWAAKTLPTLQEHQTMARDTSAKVKGGAAGAQSGTTTAPGSTTTPKTTTPKTPKTTGAK